MKETIINKINELYDLLEPLGYHRPNFDETNLTEFIRIMSITSKLNILQLVQFKEVGKIIGVKVFYDHGGITIHEWQEGTPRK